MMEGYKPTKAERAAIERGWRLIRENIKDGFAFERFTHEEQRGCGNAYDRVPLVAARGLLVSWFLDGWRKPDMLLRDTFACRPAAVFALGVGAAVRTDTDASGFGFVSWRDGGFFPAIEAAEAAYDAAFKRMHEADKAALPAAFAQARGEG
jgi:hypothetical protein